MSIEQRQDTAGHVIEILDDEFEDFTTEAQAFLAGQREEDKFIGFRLKINICKGFLCVKREAERYSTIDTRKTLLSKNKKL